MDEKDVELKQNLLISYVRPVKELKPWFNWNINSLVKRKVYQA